MPAASTPTSTAPQEVCIDLPGESVQCWRSGDKVRVVLRKHRDVIFDLKFGGNSTYTVESTISDFDPVLSIGRQVHAGTDRASRNADP